MRAFSEAYRKPICLKDEAGGSCAKRERYNPQHSLKCTDEMPEGGTAAGGRKARGSGAQRGEGSRKQVWGRGRQEGTVARERAGEGAGEGRREGGGSPLLGLLPCLLA